MKLMDPNLLHDAWEVIRIDNFDNRFRFAGPMPQQDAEKIEAHQNGLGHHQKYFARPYEPNDELILE